MIAITFLGTGNYQPATYTFRGCEATTALFPLALPALLDPPPEVIHVFETEEACARHGKLLDEAGLSHSIKRHRIPSGASEAELWTIFETLVDSIPDRAEIAFDITHSFRSIPLIALLAIAHLRIVKNVELRHLLYGAFEARDQNTEPSRTPVFDLTPMASLLDWLVAADRFRHALDATRLAELMKTIQCDAHRACDPNAPKAFLKLGKLGTGLTNSLRVGPIASIYESASELTRHLGNGMVSQEAKLYAKPLLSVLPHLSGTAQSIPLQNAGNDLEIARICLDRGLPLQAIAILREWIVSMACAHCYPEGDPLDYGSVRKPTETALNAASGRLVGDPPLDMPSANLSRFASLWSKLADTRNTAAHFGYRRQPTPTENILKQIQHQLIEAENLLQSIMQETPPLASDKTVSE